MKGREEVSLEKPSRHRRERQDDPDRTAAGGQPPAPSLPPAVAYDLAASTPGPLALMLPGVETDTLMALYYRARLLKSDRPGMAAPPAPVTAIHVLSFMTAGSPPSEFAAEFADAWDNLGRSVSSSLMVELQRRLNDVTLLGWDAVTDHRFDTYRYLQSSDAARLTRPSHLIIGSLAGAREQLLLSAWMIEAEQGTVAHSAQVIVPSGQFLFDRIGQLSRELVDQVERAHQSTPDR